jgi:hypothetical protein
LLNNLTSCQIRTNFHWLKSTNQNVNWYDELIILISFVLVLLKTSIYKV